MQLQSRSRSKTIPEKSLIDFQIKIDPRSPILDYRLPDQNRIPVFRKKSIGD